MAEIEVHNSDLLNDSLRRNFLDNVFYYYGCKTTDVTSSESFDEALKVFHKLDICQSASLYLLNTDSFEFVLYRSLPPESSTEKANGIFQQLVETGMIGRSIDSGEVLIWTNDMTPYEENTLIIPLINYSGVVGLILLQINVSAANIELHLLNLFKMYAGHLAFAIKLNQLQSELKILKESYEREIAFKTSSLMQSKMEITRILDSVQTGVFIINKSNNQILDANSVAIKMLGIPKLQLLGTDRNKYCACSKRFDRVPGELCSDIDNPGCSIFHSDGSTFFIIKKITSITLGDNEEYYLESFMDATDRRLAELELQKMKEELEIRVAERTASLTSANELLREEINENRKLFRTVEQSPVSIMIADSDWIVEYVNPSFTKLTGYTPEEVKGEPFLLLKERIISPMTLKDFYQTIRSGREWRREILSRKKSGEEFWSNTSVSAIRNSEGQIIHYITMQEDITERKVIEENLRQAKDRAEAYAKIKSEFLSLMSHEIRTPVNTILNFTSLLRMDLEKYLTPELSGGFSTITSGGLRLLRTVDLILNMADIQTDSYEAKFEDIDLNKDVAENIIKEFGQAAKAKELQLIYTNSAENTIVRADRHSIIQILLHVVDNAIKFTEKGKVEVVLSNDADKNVVIRIVDTGVGISKEYIPRMFTPFTQEESGYSRRFEGNGLGLALVKKYCDLNEAKVEIVSKKTEGTIFTITFSPSPEYYYL